MSLDDSMVVDDLLSSRYINATPNGLNNQPDLHMHRKVLKYKMDHALLKSEPWSRNAQPDITSQVPFP